MGFLQELSKCFLFFFNLIFVVVGIVLIVVGSSAFSDLGKTEEYMPFQLGRFSSILFIITGAVLLFVSFLGCCGAVKENECMLLTYASILFIVAIAQVIGFLLFYTHRDKAEDHAIDILRKGLEKYRNDTGIQQGVDYLQTHLHCCGLNSSADWDEQYKGHGYPPSCCESPVELNKKEKYCPKVGYEKSCREAINDLLNGKQKTLLWSAIISVGSILALFGITCFVVARKRHDYNYYA